MSEDNQEFGMWTGQAIKDCNYEVTPIIDQVLYARDFYFLHADGGTGKSVYVLYQMACLTSGTAFLGQYDVLGEYKVLWCQAEGTRGETVERICNMERFVDFKLENFTHLNTVGVDFTNDLEVDKFIAYTKKNNINYQVIVFDSLYGFCPGKFSDDEVAKAATKNFRRFAAEYEAAIIIISHPPKDSWASNGHKLEREAGDILGSATWRGFFTSIYKLKVKDGIHILEKGKNRSGNAIDQIEIRMITPQQDPNERLGYELSMPNTPESRQVIIRHLMTNEETYMKKLIESTGYSQVTLDKELRVLVNEGLAFKYKKTGNKNYYRWHGEAAT